MKLELYKDAVMSVDLPEYGLRKVLRHEPALAP